MPEHNNLRQHDHRIPAFAEMTTEHDRNENRLGQRNKTHRPRQGGYLAIA